MLLSCAGPQYDAEADPAALRRVAADPRAAVDACSAVRDPGLRADCVTAGAEALAAQDAAAASALCASLPPSVGADECAFQVAEKASDPAACEAAGRFADDCRLHLWSQRLRRLVPKGAAPGEVEGAAREALPTFGFSADDPRPWSALYRAVLGGRRPFDRAACDGAPDDALREACRQTGLAHYADLLNYARDSGQFPCDGGDLPAILVSTPDPELDAMVARRRAEDLCP